MNREQPQLPGRRIHWLDGVGMDTAQEVPQRSVLARFAPISHPLGGQDRHATPDTTS